jgi:magnesium chelatase family protein
MAALGAIPGDALDGYVVLGELSLDGTIASVAGALPAAIGANALGKGLICPAASGPEAAWAGEEIEILAPRSLIAIANHFRGTQVLGRPVPAMRAAPANLPDLSDIKGQETAKRALEVAAAGGHNLIMVGPPGSGKSMLAARLPSILPPLSAAELLEVSMIHSIAGQLAGGKLSDRRPFRAPHHSASMAAMVGGGLRARPGEVSLAHNGILFLDEFPEFTPQVLDSLRQPLENGESVIARANHRVSYPANIQLIAAMNPCRCGMAGEPGHSCSRGPRCQTDYQGRISGPLMDRIDIRIDVPAVTAQDLIRPEAAEKSADVALRVAQARNHAAGPLPRARAARHPHQFPMLDRRWSNRWQNPTRPDRRCSAMRPRRCGFRPAPITAFSRWRGRSPISTAPRLSAASISPRRSPTASGRSGSRRRRERRAPAGRRSRGPIRPGTA